MQSATTLADNLGISLSRKSKNPKKHLVLCLQSTVAQRLHSSRWLLLATPALPMTNANVGQTRLSPKNVHKRN